MVKAELEGNLIRLKQTKINLAFSSDLVCSENKQPLLNSQDKVINLKLRPATSYFNQPFNQPLEQSSFPTLPDEFYLTEFADSSFPVLDKNSVKTQPDEQFFSKVNFKPVNFEAFKHSNPLNLGSLTYRSISKINFRRFKKKLGNFYQSLTEFRIIWPAFTIEKQFVCFLLTAIICSAVIFGLNFLNRGLAIKEQVLGESVWAVDGLDQAKKDLESHDYDLAAAELDSASQKFAASLKRVENFNEIVNLIFTKLPGKNPYKSASNLLSAGQEFSTGAAYLAKAFTPFNALAPIMSEEVQEVSLAGQTTLTEALVSLLDGLKKAEEHLNLASQKLNLVDSNLIPSDYHSTFDDLKTNAPSMDKNLQEVKSLLASLVDFLGHNNKKRYLLIFQNNTEIRPTGGFIGSLAVLDFDQGHVSKLEVEGIYDPAGQLVEKISPPEPLRFVNGRWNIQDANWFADFPTSAKKIAWFYEKTGGPSVNGVISLTPDVIVELLKLTGSIAMPEYQTEISADNFISQTQVEVELEYDKIENKPKKFIADLAPKLIDRLLKGYGASSQDIVRVLLSAALKKQIVLFSFDEEIEEVYKKYRLAGQQRQAPFDYLSVVDTNITGGKTDHLIKRAIKVRTIITPEGEIINQVVVTRKHIGNWDWPSTKNLVYERLYTPLGSELLESRGFDQISLPAKSEDEEHYQQDIDVLASELSKTVIKKSGTEVFVENARTVFANWIGLNPGETKIVSYKYKLPLKLDLSKEGRYSLLVEKQLGAFGADFSSQIYLPFGLEAIVQSDNKSKVEPGLVLTTDNLEQDLFFGFVYSQSLN